MSLTAYCGAAIFDGSQLHHDRALVVEGSEVVGLSRDVPPLAVRRTLPGGVLLPGLVDLQVNGGGGEMVGATTDAAALGRIAAAHLRLGTTATMPTLITESAAVTARVLDAGLKARGLPGFLGLHLEGPHLDPRRAGAHDPALIRPMTEEDCDRLCAAAQQLPLIVTLAPVAASLAQIAKLSRAGVIVSLGHAEARAAEVQAAIGAGARMGTHLFNAMSPLGHREPGMVGALLASALPLGLIADGHHIHPDVLRIALAARPEGLFLVTDAMAVAGTDADHFFLNGRKVLRQDARLLLEDGTLAGADLTLPAAIALLIKTLGIAPTRAFAMATAIPAEALGLSARIGHLLPGRQADFVHLDADFALAGVWSQGERIATP